MKTLKLKLKESIDREVEITLPAYMKSNCHFWEVTDENTVIKITELNNHHDISDSYIESAFSKGNEPSTEEEFNAAYERMINYFNTKKRK
jgi:hypothetical protein